MADKHTVAVALSGSGFRLPAHVGALAALEDSGYRVVELAGTSGGALVGALYACGTPIKELRELCLHQDWSKVMGLPLWDEIWSERMFDGAKLLKWLDDRTRTARFDGLRIPLHVVASDLVTGSRTVFDAARSAHMPVALAARASSSLPVVFKPVRHAGGVYQDGGMCDNLPLDLLTHKADLTLGVSLSVPKRNTDLDGLVDLLLADLDLMLSASQKIIDAEAIGAGAQAIHIDCSYASMLDSKMPFPTRARLYNDGYQAVLKRLAALA